MKSFIGFVAVMLVGSWFLANELSFDQSRRELADSIVESYHSFGQKTAERILDLVQPNVLAETRKVVLIETARRVYDPYKPEYCWESPYSLLRQLNTEYMFGLARVKNPHHNGDGNKAMTIARQNPEFQHFLLLEDKLMDICHLEYRTRMAGSWKELDVMRSLFETAKADLKKLLGQDPRKEVEGITPPKVFVPFEEQRPNAPVRGARRKRDQWC